MIPIRGFTIFIKHGEEGFPSQIRLIRISINTNPEGEKIQFQQISKVIIPLVKSNSYLHFDFPSIKISNIYKFEFLANYGGTKQG